MSAERDQMTILEQLKPLSVVETGWPAPARAAALERVLSTAAEGSPEVPRPSRRRRLLVAAALAAVLVPSGVGVAAAGGVLPQTFTRELAFWTSDTGGGVDVETARRVAQMPGPDGKVLSVWAATGKDGTTCVSPVFEAPGELDRPAPENFQVGGGSCPTAAQQSQETFGSLGGSMDEHGIHTMWGAMGKAVRAELHLSNGTVRPAAAAEGQFFFWYLADRTVDSPELVGYDRAGQIVGRVRLPNLVTQSHVGG